MAADSDDRLPPPAPPPPGLFAPAPPLAEVLERFWDEGPEADAFEARIEPPQQPLEVLERLGAAPFERGRFPLIGFLATTYEKVSRFALDRR